MMKKSMPRRHEGSMADRMADRKGAKAKGVSVATYEGSPADRKADAKMMRRKGKK